MILHFYSRFSIFDLKGLRTFSQNIKKKIINFPPFGVNSIYLNISHYITHMTSVPESLVLYYHLLYQMA